MNILKLIIALFLTPIVFGVLLFLFVLFIGLWEMHGKYIIGFVFLIGWLLLIFIIIYGIL